jgi:hypothetical protein
MKLQVLAFACALFAVNITVAGNDEAVRVAAAAAVEMVTVMKNEDRSWRVSGDFIK